MLWQLLARNVSVYPSFEPIWPPSPNRWKLHCMVTGCCFPSCFQNCFNAFSPTPLSRRWRESSHEHGFKPLVRWISRRTNTWTRFERCDRWRLWCHHPQCIPFGAELDASEGITCTQSCQVVDDRWSGEILLALLAALGPRFGLHTDIADYDRISEAFLGFAGGSPAHILE